MSKQRAYVLPVDPERVKAFGPGTIEHRTADSGFDLLGTYLLEFAEGGHADPWMLQYEETIYVAAGELSLIVSDEDGTNTDLRAKAGEVVAIHAGATVQYGGIPGTHLVVSIAPVDWATRNATN